MESQNIGHVSNDQKKNRINNRGYQVRAFSILNFVT